MYAVEMTPDQVNFIWLKVRFDKVQLLSILKSSWLKGWPPLPFQATLTAPRLHVVVESVKLIATGFVTQEPAVAVAVSVYVPSGCAEVSLTSHTGKVYVGPAPLRVCAYFNAPP